MLFRAIENASGINSVAEPAHYDGQRASHGQNEEDSDACALVGEFHG